MRKVEHRRRQMSKSRGRWTIDELVEMDSCPCDICSSQDDEETLMDRQKLNEACDVISNEIIDLIIENPKKYLLKNENKEDNVK